MSIEIVPIAESHVESFHAALDVVAREQRYLAVTQAPPLERTREFVRGNLAADVPQFVALDGARVVGWADILPAWPQSTNHRGGLGIGLLPGYRGRGIGRQLLQACIEKAWQKGMTRVDLETRADNAAAIALYEKLGFKREGLVRNGMRFGGAYYDCVLMGLVRE